MKKWFAVIGDPIEQSMSPRMHDVWFIENNIDATYIPIHVKSDELEQAVNSLKKMGCSGWNVTVPHKTAIIPYLDRLEPSAVQMNVVNTVQVMEDGSLVGSNTDGPGFVRSLEQLFQERGKNVDVLLIGAGGAAKGIAHALHSSGYGPIIIANRTLDKAERLASEIEGASALALADAEKDLSRFGLIIQTTMVGMNYAYAGSPIASTYLSEGSIVADIIYNPLETAFLQDAKEKGALTMNGVGMFVHQGALAFAKWTGVTPNTINMEKTITSSLGGVSC